MDGAATRDSDSGAKVVLGVVDLLSDRWLGKTFDGFLGLQWLSQLASRIARTIPVSAEGWQPLDFAISMTSDHLEFPKPAELLLPSSLDD